MFRLGNIRHQVHYVYLRYCTDNANIRNLHLIFLLHEDRDQQKHHSTEKRNKNQHKPWIYLPTTTVIYILKILITIRIKLNIKYKLQICIVCEVTLI